MIQLEIPGKKTIEASHLVLDFNGTLAIDGKLIAGTRALLGSLSKQLYIHVLTADTFGTAKDELAGIDCTLKIINSDDQDVQKESYLYDLVPESAIAIGNGANDVLMLRIAALGIGVIEKEGASVKSLMNADILCTSVLDALGLILNTRRIVATLRN